MTLDTVVDFVQAHRKAILVLGVGELLVELALVGGLVYLLVKCSC